MESPSAPLLDESEGGHSTMIEVLNLPEAEEVMNFIFFSQGMISFNILSPKLFCAPLGELRVETRKMKKKKIFCVFNFS